MQSCNRCLSLKRCRFVGLQLASLTVARFAWLLLLLQLPSCCERPSLSVLLLLPMPAALGPLDDAPGSGTRKPSHGQAGNKPPASSCAGPHVPRKRGKPVLQLPPAPRKTSDERSKHMGLDAVYFPQPRTSGAPSPTVCRPDGQLCFVS